VAAHELQRGAAGHSTVEFYSPPCTGCWVTVVVNAGTVPT
jgi:hypothetical protein